MKRAISLLLATLMLTSSFPVNVFADTGKATESVVSSSISASSNKEDAETDSSDAKENQKEEVVEQEDKKETTVVESSENEDTEKEIKDGDWSSVEVARAESFAKSFSSLPSETFENGKSNRVILYTENDKDLSNVDLGSSTYLGYKNFAIVQYDSVEKAEKSIESLEKIDGILHAELDQEVLVATDENTPTDSSDEYIYLKSKNENRNVVAVIDSGVNEGYDKRLWLVDESKSENYASEDGRDNNGHGTDVTKNILEKANGTADILSIKAFDKNGTGSLSSVLAAMEIAYAEGAKYINVSAANKDEGTSKVAEAIVKDLVDKKVTVVLAAGNNSTDASKYALSSIKEATVVGSVDINNMMTELTNFGSTVDYYALSQYTSIASAIVIGYLSKGGFGEDVQTSAAKYEPTVIENAPEPTTENESVVSSSNTNEESVVSSSNDFKEEGKLYRPSLFSTIKKLMRVASGYFSRGFKVVSSDTEGNPIWQTDNGRVNTVDYSEVGKVTVRFDNYPNYIVITKVDANNPNLRLGGAKFHIWWGGQNNEYKNNYNASPYKHEVVTESRDYTNDDGISMLGRSVVYGLRPGTWYYQEIEPPTGYRDRSPYPIRTFMVDTDSNIVGGSELPHEINMEEIHDKYNILVVKKDNTGATIQGVTFNINIEGIMNKTFITNETGYVSTPPKISKDNKFYKVTVTEISVPANSGVILDNTPRTFYVRNGLYYTSQNLNSRIPGIEYTFTDNRNSFKIQKLDENGNGLANAKFTIWKDGEVFNDSVFSDENGWTQTFYGLEAGNYSWKEIANPTGYIIDSTTHYFKVNSDGTINVDTTSSWTGGTLVRDGQASTTCRNTPNQYIIYKQSSNGSRLSGVPFHIWSDDGKYNENKTTDSNGIITLSKLPNGTYYFQEEDNQGYVKDTKTYKFVVSETGITGDTHSTSNPSLTVTNTPNKFTLRKVDESGNLVTGTVFTMIYTDTRDANKRNSNPIKNPFTGQNGTGSADVTLTSGTMSWDRLPEGSYSFVEKTPKDPTWKLDTTVHTFKVSNSGEISSNDSTVVIQKNSSAQLTITAKNEKYKKFNVRVTKTDSKTLARLSGAVFALYPLENGNPVTSKRSVLKEISTGVYYLSGVQIDSLNNGNYRIVEEKTPDGYAGTWQKDFNVDNNSIESDNSYTVDLQAENIPIEAKFRKVDDANKPLKDAVFRVWKDGSTFSKEVKSDVDGWVYFNSETLGVPLSQGTWHYKEIQAPTTPQKYDMELDANGNVINHTFVVTATGINNQTEFTLPEVIDPVHTPIPVRIALTKQDSGSTSLSGAKFNVYEWDVKINSYKTTPSAELVENVNDKTYYNNKELRADRETNNGKFRIVEVTAPEGFTPEFKQGLVTSNKVFSIVNKGIEFTVDMNDKNEQTFTFVATDDKNKIRVKKVDENGKGLYNAEFTLTKQKDYRTSVETSVSVKSDRDGWATFEKIIPGEYVLTETKGVAGYVKSDLATNITVSTEGYVYLKGHPTTSSDLELSYTNPSNKLTIAKVNSNKQPLANVVFEIWFENQSHTRYTTDSNGLITRKNLSPGTWHIKEVQDDTGKAVNGTEHIVVVNEDGKLRESTADQNDDAAKNESEYGAFVQDLTITIVNHGTVEGSLRLRKIDKDNPNTVLTDAQFYLEELNTATGKYQFATRDGNPLVIVYNSKTGYYELYSRTQDGTYTYNGAQVPNYVYTPAKLIWDESHSGKYRVYEGIAQSGYKSNDWSALVDITGNKTNWVFDLVKDSSGKIISGTDQPAVTNEKNIITIEKYDLDTDKPVSGIGFTITKVNVDSNNNESLSTTDVFHVTTDSNGKAVIRGLTNSSIYRIQEDPAYTTNKEYYLEPIYEDISVDQEGKVNGSYNYVYKAHDPQYSVMGSLDILKKDEENSGAKVPGAEFTIYQWNKNLQNYEVTPYEPITKVNGEYKLSTVKWAYDAQTGIYHADNIRITDVNEGRFKVVETKNPIAYTSDWSANVVFDKNHKTSVQNISLTATNLPVGILHTTAIDNTTDSQIQIPDDEASITDRVAFHNLDVGRTYTIKGIIMDQDTNAPFVDSSNDEIKSEVTFTISQDGKSLTVNSYTAEKHGVNVQNASHNYKLGIYPDKKWSEDGLQEGKIRKDGLAQHGVVDGWIELPFYMDSTTNGGSTIVVFEDLYSPERNINPRDDVFYTSSDEQHKGEKVPNGTYPVGLKVAEHKKIDDDDQTINIIVPEIKTTLASIETGENESQEHAEGISNTETLGTWDHVGKVSKQGILRDTIGVLGLSSKNTYVVEGRLAYKRDFTDENGKLHKAGEIVTDANGKQITATRTQKWNTTTNTRIYDSSVTPKTYTLDKTTQKITGVPFQPLEGTLVNENGEFMDEQAQHQKSIIKKELNYINIEYNLNSTNLEGAEIVALENLYVIKRNGNVFKLSGHEYVDDAKESVYYQSVHTNAESEVTNTQVTEKSDAPDIIWDTVTVKGLRVSPVKMTEQINEDTKNPIYIYGRKDGIKVDGSTNYQKYPSVLIEKDGVYEYQVHGTLMSKTLNSEKGQKIYVNGKSVENRVSFSIDDEGNVSITNYTSKEKPVISKTTVHRGDMIIAVNDRDEKGVIYKDANGIPTKKISTINLPETIDIEIKVPLEIEDIHYLEGQHTVVFEDLLHKSTTWSNQTATTDWHEVSHHHDINDEGQSIFFRMYTTLFTGGKGITIFYVIGGVLIIGVVCSAFIYKKKKKKIKKM